MVRKMPSNSPTPFNDPAPADFGAGTEKSVSWPDEELLSDSFAFDMEAFIVVEQKERRSPSSKPFAARLEHRSGDSLIQCKFLDFMQNCRFEILSWTLSLLAIVSNLGCRDRIAVGNPSERVVNMEDALALFR
jgi:hypothetical protein